MATKVLYVINSLRAGGSEGLLLGLTKNLDRSRYDPVVTALAGGEMSPVFKRAGVKVCDLGARSRFDVRVGWRLLRTVLAEKPAILHSHQAQAGILCRVIGRLCGTPVIVETVRWVDLLRGRGLLQWLDRWTSRRFCAAHAVVSEEVRRAVADIERMPGERITVIPDGLDAALSLTERERAARRATMAVPGDGLLVTVVSPLEKRNGEPVLLEIIRHLGNRWPNVRCAIIGEGPARDALESQARALGLHSRITFLGDRGDAGSWAGSSDLFVLPALMEGASLAVLEAMAAGAPIIAAAAGGIAELIVDGDSGLLVPAGNARALTQAVDRLLGDRAFARRLGYIARHRFLERFEAQRYAAMTADWYDALIAPQAADGARPPAAAVSAAPAARPVAPASTEAAEASRRMEAARTGG